MVQTCLSYPKQQAQNNFKIYKDINVLKPYLIPKSKKVFRSKRFSLLNYDNLKVQGILFREVNWEMCFNISFYIYVTEAAREYFSSDSFKLFWWIQKFKLGHFKLSNEIKENSSQIPWWDFDPDVVVAYSHERNLKTLKFCKHQFFSLDMNLYPPDTYQAANDYDGINSIYLDVCNWISNLNCFQNHEFIEFRSFNTKKGNTT